MSGAPLPRFGGLGSFDGVDEFEDLAVPADRRRDGPADVPVGGGVGPRPAPPAAVERRVSPRPTPSSRA